jgi:hypothetical protein
MAQVADFTRVAWFFVRLGLARAYSHNYPTFKYLACKGLATYFNWLIPIDLL